MENAAITGRIIKLSEKGYGFIISQEMKFTRFFFHWTALDKNFNFLDLREGMRVEFVPIEVERKDGRTWRALHVKVLNGIEKNENKGQELD